MKLSASNRNSEMQGVGVPMASVDPMDNATAGNVASVVKTDTDGAMFPQKSKQRFSGKMLLKQRRKFANNTESATDSSEHFTENELHTPTVGKHRHKTLNSKY